MPSGVIYTIGISFVQYIRGSARSTNLPFEVLLDAVSVSVILIRFFLQNIRFVFIFIAFFEYYEYITLHFDPNLTGLVAPFTWEQY